LKDKDKTCKQKSFKRKIINYKFLQWGGQH